MLLHCVFYAGKVRRLLVRTALNGRFGMKKADAEMVSALGVMLWFVISTKMQDRGSCLRYP